MAGQTVIFRRLSEVGAVATAHAVGLKKVLLSSAETPSAVTQIAVTSFKADETAESHVHPTMDEHYFFMEGEGEMTVGDTVCHCRPGDYLLVPAGSSHRLTAVKAMKFMTIGIAYDK